MALYEAACSPLDMGVSPGLVGPGRRPGYVPSTAFVARRAALLALGGFDERLRFGDDVDLIWRLVSAEQRPTPPGSGPARRGRARPVR